MLAVVGRMRDYSSVTLRYLQSHYHVNWQQEREAGLGLDLSEKWTWKAATPEDASLRASPTQKGNQALERNPILFSVANHPSMKDQCLDPRKGWGRTTAGETAETEKAHMEVMTEMGCL